MNKAWNIAAAVVLWIAFAGTGSAGALDRGRDLLLTAKPVTGTVASKQSLSGKPVIVTFFASWCPPCTQEFAALNDVRGRYGEDKVAIVAVNAFEDWDGRKNPARMARFLAQTRPSFQIVEGSDEILRVFGNVERIPTLIIYDPAGREVWRFVHEVNAVKRSATAQEISAVLDQINWD